MSQQPPTQPDTPSAEDLEWPACGMVNADRKALATSPAATPGFTIDKTTLERLESRLGYAVDIPTRD